VAPTKPKDALYSPDLSGTRSGRPAGRLLGGDPSSVFRRQLGPL